MLQRHVDAAVVDMGRYRGKVQRLGEIIMLDRVLGGVVGTWR